MKILLINHYAGGSKYGMEFRPLYLAREWVKLGHEVTIIAADQSHVRNRNPDLNTSSYTELLGLNKDNFKTETIDGVRFIWCRTPKYNGNGLGRVKNIITFLLRLFQMSFWIKKHLMPDSIITSSTYPMDIFPARFIQKICKTKSLVYEVHDLWPLSPMELGGMSRFHPFIMWVQMAEDFSYQWATKVVSMLPKAKEHMVSRGMALSKFVYIPNAIDFSEWNNIYNSQVFENEMSEIRQKHDLIVGYFGTFGLANALNYFIDAAKLSAQQGLNIAFILVGGGPEKEVLEEQVRHQHIQNVYFIEPVKKTEVPAALEKIDVAYIGLQKQSLFRFGISPNKLIDYMAAKKPILFAVESGNNPVAEARCGVSVPAENAQAIVDGLKKFKTLSQAELDQMGERASEFVRNNHDYKLLAQKFLNNLF